jgi:hypothetical protein
MGRKEDYSNHRINYQKKESAAALSITKEKQTQYGRKSKKDGRIFSKLRVEIMI